MAFNHGIEIVEPDFMHSTNLSRTTSENQQEPCPIRIDEDMPSFPQILRKRQHQEVSDIDDFFCLDQAVPSKRRQYEEPSFDYANRYFSQLRIEESDQMIIQPQPQAEQHYYPVVQLDEIPFTQTPTYLYNSVGTADQSSNEFVTSTNEASSSSYCITEEAMELPKKSDAKKQSKKNSGAPNS